MAKRKLTDLYVVGKEVTFDDGQGPVTVWIQKLNQIQNDEAFKRANAQRAKVLTAKRLDENDPVKLAYYGELAQLSENTDDLVDFLAYDDYEKARITREAQVAAEEEWSKDDYLDGLLEAWEAGLKDDYARDPEDAEAKRVFDEMKRFATQVEELVEKDKKTVRRDYSGKSEETIRRLAVEKLIDADADSRWLLEFRKWELFFATRNPEDHTERLFESREDIDLLPDQVLTELIGAVRDLTVEPIEGKD